jgi:antitoxin component YwqK of YwqJK toxin-antitoxin module
MLLLPAIDDFMKDLQMLLLLLSTIAITCGCVNPLASDRDETKSTGKAIDGKKQGIWRTYHGNGQLLREEIYQNDTLNGTSITYDENGRVYTKCQYRMGVMVDSFTHYYGNGKVNFWKWHDSTGKTQGPMKVFDANGEVRQEGQFKDDHMEGVWKTFYPNGKVKDFEFYRNNERDSIWTYFDEDGNVTEQKDYRRTH